MLTIVLLALSCCLTAASHPFKVFGVGLPSTGGEALAQKLQSLGFDVVVNDPALVTFLQANETAYDFYSSYRELDGAVNVPTSLYFREILRTFPDARFILKVRPEAEWMQAVMKEISDARISDSPHRPIQCNDPAARAGLPDRHGSHGSVIPVSPCSCAHNHSIQAASCCGCQ
jgi:hypothetical protein